MAGLADFRAQHPEYNDMSDVDLATALHNKYYSDLPKGDVFDKLGVTPGPSGSTTGTATPRKTASAFPSGMVDPGTQNPLDRRYGGSSVSFEFSEDGIPKEVIVPNVVDGKTLTKSEAIARYRKTGEHFGKFDTPANADAFVKSLTAPTVAKTSPMATQEHAPSPSIAESATALAEGVGKGALNVGGIVGERAAPGYEEARAARAEQAPVESTIGYLVGAALGGGAVAKGISAIPRVGAALATTVGQPIRNFFRLGATGAAAGGAQAGAEGENIPAGASLGAVGGPLAAGAGKVVKAATRAASGVVSQSARSLNAMRALGKRLNMTPNELTTALDNFAAQNGREASLADIADLETRGMLKQYASKNPAFGAEVARETERRATQPPQVQTGSPTQPEDVASLVTRRDQRIRNILGDSNDPRALRNAPVTSGVGAPQVLGNPRVIRALRGDQELTQLVNEALTEPTSQPLTVDDFENLRQQLRQAQKTAAASNSIRARKIADVADAVEAYAVARQPRYGRALSQYRQDSNYIDAFEHGRKGKTLTDVNDPMLHQTLISPEGRQGYAVGSAERRAAENLDSIAPGFIKPPVGMTDSQAAHLAVAGAKIGSPWSIYHLARAMPGIKASDDTLRLAARYLTDPTLARQGVALLRRSGASDAAISKLLTSVGGAAAGGAQ